MGEGLSRRQGRPRGWAAKIKSSRHCKTPRFRPGNRKCFFEKKGPGGHGVGDYNHEAIELAPFHSNARNDVKEGSTFTWRRSANPECLSMRSMASRAHACTCSSSTDTSKRPLEKVSEGPLGDSTFQSFPERSEDIQALCRASVDALQHAASRRDQWRCLSAPPDRAQ